jgi:catechol 2,3-dioxygenase-like lactoylglutathione lyase family enzyme
MDGGASQLGFCVDQLDHVELFVPDRWEAAEWYGRVLGLTVVPEAEVWAEDPRGPLMVSSDRGSTKLALFEGEPQGERPTAGFHRVAFRVGASAFATFVGRLSELGLVDEAGNPVDAGRVADHDAAWSIYFSDPFGHRLEVTTYEYDEARVALARVAG